MHGEHNKNFLPSSPVKWKPAHVREWLNQCGFGNYAHLLCDVHKINGTALLLLQEDDLRNPPLKIEVLGDIKNLMLHLSHLRSRHREEVLKLSYAMSSSNGTHHHQLALPYENQQLHYNKKRLPSMYRNHQDEDHLNNESFTSYHEDLMNQRERESSPVFSESSTSLDEFNFASPADGNPKSPGMATQLEPEIWKTVISMSYFFLVTILTSLVMVVVHDRVPDMKKYPPLPDIFLDNVPLIPWAFGMCEVTGCLLGITWILVLVFHKHRFILMRRFFALTGTVFLLRCVTMIITSLSVPGTHLECSPRPYGNLWAKLEKALEIWQGFGMSVAGVRTCGDYMFSGHTVTLTMLNFFITEYTPRRIYFLHTFAWICNLFGIFFILAGREHYSIDVFVAFYITSRVFLYYHTLANSGTLRTKDRHRARIWFPLFSFFEARINGMVPNEYEMPWDAIPRASIQNAFRKVFQRSLKAVGYSSASTANNISKNHKPPSSLNGGSKRSKKKN